MSFWNRQNNTLQAQREIIAKAGRYIEQLQGQLADRQAQIDSWPGGKRYTLGDLEGYWQIPVRMEPDSKDLIVALQGLPEGLPALSVLRITSAFAERSRLEDMELSGWALVRAYPINCPAGVSGVPGQQADGRYLLCALTDADLQTTELPTPNLPPKPKRGGENFELRV